MGSPAAVKLKLRRRTLDLNGERFTVLALRPTTTARFATTEYHETWHILSDVEGTELLGRLSWAMAFQTRPHTVLLIDLPLIAPDPFDALRSQLPQTDVSEGSVRLMTAGFDRALIDPDRFWTQERADDPAFKAHQHARWVERANGVVVLAAPSPVLRHWAVRVAVLAQQGPLDPAWTPVDDRKWTGEVQVLAASLS